MDGIGNYSAPPEHCEEDALPGSEYCSRHQPDNLYPDGYDWE